MTTFTDVERLNEREAKILLAHFLHYLPQSADAPAGSNNRGTLGETYPTIYNKLCGRTIVETTWPRDRERAEEERHERETKIARLLVEAADRLMICEPDVRYEDGNIRLARRIEAELTPDATQLAHAPEAEL